LDLGETRVPAHVLLDGRPVCEATMRSPGCTVDLGPDPRLGAAVTSPWLDLPRDALIAGSLGAGVFGIPLGGEAGASSGLH
jgi:hypothetical protein